MENQPNTTLSDFLKGIDPLENPSLCKPQAPKVLKEKLLELMGQNPRGVAGLKEALQFYTENSINTAHPMFMNQLWSGFSQGGVLGEAMGAAYNTSMYTTEMAPVTTLIEQESVRVLGQLMGLENPEGTFVPGGSYGNMVGLLLARQNLDPRIKEEGLQNTLAIFVSEDSHYSFLKAANIMGLGQDNVIKVAVNRSGEMSPEALSQAIAKARTDGKIPLAVGVTAGTTVRAAFDPVQEISEICQRENIWMHLDGALGGSMAFSKDQKEQHLKGAEHADSIAWNLHKLMGVPMHCSVVLCKHRDLLQKSSGLKAADTNYLFHNEGEVDLGLFSLQCGRKADVLKFWMAWVQEGLDGFSDRVDSIVNIAKYAESKVNDHDKLELICPRNSVTVCFQYKHPGFSLDQNNALNKKIREALFKEAELAINFGWVHGALSLRIVPFNPALREHHIDKTLELIAEKGALLGKELQPVSPELSL